MGTKADARCCTQCGARLAGDNKASLCRPCERSARADALSPPGVPPEFWENKDIRDALVIERHIGHAVRQYRRHPFHGRRAIPLEVASNWLGISHTQLSRIERGRAISDLDRLIQWARVLQIPQELLWFDLPAEAPNEGDDVERRRFLAVSGATAAGIISAGSIKTPELRPVSEDSFEFLYKKRDVLRDADNFFGPERVIPLVGEQITSIRKLGNSARGNDRRRLLDVQAQFADLYAWLHQDSGNASEARYWLDRALDWSQMASNPEAVTFILARKSQVAGELNDATDAVGMAEVAMQYAQSRYWRAATVAATYAAHGYALQGDKTSFQREYDHAYEMLQKVEPDPNASYGLFLNTAYIDVQRASSLAALGEHALAAQAFGKSIDALPDGYHRDRGIYLIRKALAHAGAKEPDQAVTTGLQALSIGTETNSARIINGLAQLNTVLSQWNTLPRVSEFRRELSRSV